MRPEARWPAVAAGALGQFSDLRSRSVGTRQELTPPGTFRDPLGKGAVVAICSDGRRFQRVDLAVAQAHRMLAEGPQIIDADRESIRPGADRRSAEKQIRRVAPAVRVLRNHRVCRPRWADIVRKHAVRVNRLAADGA